MLSKTQSFAQLPPRNQPETVNLLQTATQQHAEENIPQPGSPGKAGLFYQQAEPQLSSKAKLRPATNLLLLLCHPPTYHFSVVCPPPKHARIQTPLIRETPSTVFRKTSQEKQ